MSMDLYPFHISEEQMAAEHDRHDAWLYNNEEISAQGVRESRAHFDATHIAVIALWPMLTDPRKIPDWALARAREQFENLIGIIDKEQARRDRKLKRKQPQGGTP